MEKSRKKETLPNKGTSWGGRGGEWGGMSKISRTREKGILPNVIGWRIRGEVGMVKRKRKDKVGF